MATLRLLTLILAASLGLAAAPDARADMLHDPWCERFQVGQFREPQSVSLTAGWPEGLLAPLAVDPGWLAGAGLFFAGDAMPRETELAAWRLAYPACADPDGAESSYRQARAHWEMIVRLVDGRSELAPVFELTMGPWRSVLYRLQACRLWQAGRSADAARLIEVMLGEAEALALEPHEIFVWTLRAQMLRAGCLAPAEAAAVRPRDDAELWRSQLALGPYDARSGWAVWVALQRARGLPPLTGERADRQGGVMLAAAGKLFCTAAELHEAGFPPDVAAGLGALLLPASDLPAHFERWPLPPTDGLFQGYWLQGQRRLRSSAHAIESLAGLAGLLDGHRLDLWRRASEGYLLRDEWEPGLRALESGLRLLGGQASATMRERLRIWIVQALALALARQRLGDAARIEALAAEYLTGDDAQAFAKDAGPLLAGDGTQRTTNGTGADLRARHEALVLEGEADIIAAGEPAALPAPAHWRHHLWACWARWGQALLAAAPSVADSAGDYRAALADVLDAADPLQRHTIAAAAAARQLRETPDLTTLLHWAMARDIERLSEGACLPHRSPLPRLNAPRQLAGWAQHLHVHALMGAALALGDDRGLLAMAIRLPAAGAREMDRLPFSYPVPGDPAIRRALSASGLPVELLLAIARNESLFEPAIRSRAGALGYMQIMPFHYLDPAGPSGPQHWRHPAASLQAGSRVLSEEVRRHGGDPYRSVAAYNAGSVPVLRWDQQLQPGTTGRLYRAWISYPETRGYTLRVLRDRAIYRALLSAAAP